VINKQANILFIPTSIGGYSAEPQAALSQNRYFQQLIYASLARSTYTIEGFQVLGRQLAAIARHADLAKQMNAVEQASQVMLALPISDQLESIARYYQALCSWQRGELNSTHQFERAAENVPSEYKARALQTIGAIYHKRGELDAALPFYLAAGKAAAGHDWLALAESQWMIAEVRSIHGDHKGALADLERLFPHFRALAKYYPPSYYDFLNSLAVELGEVGRIVEAEAVCAITLASQFSAVHPNWSETRDEIAAKRVSATPSVVAVKRIAQPASSPRVATKRNTKPVIKCAFSYPPGNKDFFQRSTIKAPAIGTIALNAVGVLDRIHLCIGPRAPPVLS
jgi:tetratricopeptide (TPR) repeat protein